jgi:transposase-like protein
LTYVSSIRQLVPTMTVDHSTIHRWTLKLMPVLERTFRKRKAISSGNRRRFITLFIAYS